MTVHRTNVPVLERVRPAVPFPAGAADVIVAITFDRLECGCSIEYGVRLDNAEKVMLGAPCAVHKPRWAEVVQALQEDTESPDTGILIERLIAGLDA